MGWLSQGVFDELRAAALALTPSERAALTWEQATKFVALDTVEIAMWSGLSRSQQLTPWEAVCKVRLIPVETPTDRQQPAF